MRTERERRADLTSRVWCLFEWESPDDIEVEHCCDRLFGHHGVHRCDCGEKKRRPK